MRDDERVTSPTKVIFENGLDEKSEKRDERAAKMLCLAISVQPIIIKNTTVASISIRHCLPYGDHH